MGGRQQRPCVSDILVLQHLSGLMKLADTSISERPRRRRRLYASNGRTRKRLVKLEPSLSWRRWIQRKPSQCSGSGVSLKLSSSLIDRWLKRLSNVKLICGVVVVGLGTSRHYLHHEAR